MAVIARSIATSLILLATVLAAAGCNETAAAPGAGDSKQVRLLKDESARLNDQIATLNKRIEEQKTTLAVVEKDRDLKEKSYTETANYFMDQIKDKDAEIQKLQARVAEMEKHLAESRGK
jgi:hypothetical protein